MKRAEFLAGKPFTIKSINTSSPTVYRYDRFNNVLNYLEPKSKKYCKYADVIDLSVQYFDAETVFLNRPVSAVILFKNCI